MSKVFFIYKTEHHNLWNKYENGKFNSNGSIYNFYTNLPKISFIHKMSKNKTYTWNEHLLSTQNENLRVKPSILKVYPIQFQNKHIKN